MKNGVQNKFINNCKFLTCVLVKCVMVVAVPAVPLPTTLKTWKNMSKQPSKSVDPYDRKLLLWIKLHYRHQIEFPPTFGVGVVYTLKNGTADLFCKTVIPGRVSVFSEKELEVLPPTLKFTYSWTQFSQVECTALFTLFVQTTEYECTILLGTGWMPHPVGGGAMGTTMSWWHMKEIHPRFEMVTSSY